MNRKPKFTARIKQMWSRRHWLILAVVIFLSALYELLEFAARPSYFNDPYHVLELILHGVILPAVLLTLQRTETQKNRAVTTLSLRDSFVDQLNRARNWDELLEIIGEFPRNIIPLSGVCLLLRSPNSNKFDLELARVFDPSLELQDPPNLIQLGETECCKGVEGVVGLRTCHCSLQLQKEKNKNLYHRYCLPLSDADDILGLLHFYLPTSYKLAKEQKDFFGSIVPEIALSINEASLKRAGVLREAAIETERLRLASDLHDTLGQDLAYLRNKIDQLLRGSTLRRTLVLKQELNQMRIVAEEANQTVRNILAVTHSNQGSLLDDRLLAYARAIGERAGLKISLASHGEAYILNPHMQFQIFLIFREILANIEKHADAHSATIDLAWLDNEFEMTITDDGRGFQTERLDKNNHFGLTILETRTREMNGHLSIISVPNEGTKVSIRLPIDYNESLPLKESVIDEDNSPG